jgi:hypothetical protein
MDGLRWTAAIWIAFVALVGMLAYAMLTACDIGRHPLFALRYCRAQASPGLLSEQARERDLLDRLHQAQLNISRLPVCLPEPPPREPERRADIVPAPSPSPTLSPSPTPSVAPTATPTPDDRLVIPHNVNDLNGCWQSVRGDIPLFSDDREHRLVGHRRICYCFSGDGAGQVRQIIQEGGRCVAPLKVQLSGGQLKISHGTIPCSGVSPTIGDNVVPGDVICRKKPDEDVAICDRISHLKSPITYRDETYHRVSADYCN